MEGKIELDPVDEPSRASAPTSSVDISTRRLHVVVAGLWLALFISAMDTTIVTTALFKISSEFHSLRQSGWLVVSFLLTYNSFLMISAKLSDIWGLRNVLLSFTAFFLIFSIACGVAQTMNQLIVFRAFQGIGGSGIYSLVFVTIMKLSTPEKMAFYSGVISSVFALANCIGPLLGGAIAEHTTWRWIFYINGPLLAAAFVILYLSLPKLVDGKTNKERLFRFDVIGGILSICWSIPLLFALQEGGGEHAWNSSVILGTLTSGIIAFIIFGLYEAYITYKTKKEPIFPVRLLTDPVVALILLSMFLLGIPFYVTVIQLPQRFQAVNNASSQRAGILLLPLMLLTPFGAMSASMIMGKLLLSAEYILVISTGIISIGIGLLGYISIESRLEPAVYGYEIIIGFGLGTASAAILFLIATVVDKKRDLAAATGAINMLRAVGGSVGVAICSALLNSSFGSEVRGFLTPVQVSALLESISAVDQLAPELQVRVGRTFGRIYNKQFRVMIAFAVLNFIVSVVLLLLRIKQGALGKRWEDMQGNQPVGAAVQETGVGDDKQGAGSLDMVHETRTEDKNRTGHIELIEEGKGK